LIKAEHSYISHMYGAVNYVFIDDLAKLPGEDPGDLSKADNVRNQ